MSAADGVTGGAGGAAAAAEPAGDGTVADEPDGRAAAEPRRCLRRWTPSAHGAPAPKEWYAVIASRSAAHRPLPSAGPPATAAAGPAAPLPATARWIDRGAPRRRVVSTITVSDGSRRLHGAGGTSTACVYCAAAVALAGSFAASDGKRAISAARLCLFNCDEYRRAVNSMRFEGSSVDRAVDRAHSWTARAARGANAHAGAFGARRRVSRRPGRRRRDASTRAMCQRRARDCWRATDNGRSRDAHGR